MLMKVIIYKLININLLFFVYLVAMYRESCTIGESF